MSNLVGDIKSETTSEKVASEIITELEAFMIKHKIDRIDVSWKRPTTCSRCGEPIVGIVEDGGELEGEIKPGVKKSDAMDMLNGVVEKMPSQEIALEIPGVDDDTRR